MSASKMMSVNPIDVNEDTKGKGNALFAWFDNCYLLFQHLFHEITRGRLLRLEGCSAEDETKPIGIQNTMPLSGGRAENRLHSVNINRVRLWTPPSTSEIKPWIALIGDVVSEDEGAGYDVVFSDVDMVLSSNLEQLVLTADGWGVNATGNAQHNQITGNAADNSLDGGGGNDTMEGGLGDDTYHISSTGDVVIETADAGNDTVISDVDWTLGSHLENLILSETGAISATGNDLDNHIVGNAADNRLNGRGGDDTLVGGWGNDVYTVDNLFDVVTEGVGEGLDMIISDAGMVLPENVEALVLNVVSTVLPVISASGNALDNLLRGGDANEMLIGGGGNDILEGGGGDDCLRNWVGTACFNGGAGNDLLIGDAGVEIYLGGLGNDKLNSGAGNDIILFNAGDGQDTLSAGGTGYKTLSLGGNFAYSDLTLSQSERNLVLTMGTADQITFEDWYAATPSRPVVNLQVITETMSDFNPGGSDPLLNHKVERFDFAGLVGDFDTARAAMPALSLWSLNNALLDAHLTGSDNVALGGDLAYQYGRHGTLAGIGLAAAQAVIGDSTFGMRIQAFHPLVELQSGAIRLS